MTQPVVDLEHAIRRTEPDDPAPRRIYPAPRMIRGRCASS